MESVLNNVKATAAAVRHDPRNVYRSSPFGNKTGTGNIRFCAVWNLESQAVSASCIYYNGGSKLTAPRAALQYSELAAKVLEHGSGTIRQYGCLSVAGDDGSVVDAMATGKSILLVVRADEYPQRVAFKLLADLNEYMEMRASVDKQMLLMLCEKYDDVGAVEPIIAVQRQVDATTAIMSANVRMMIEAHERLETLEEQAEHLSDSAKKFKKASRQVKQTMRWVDIRMKLLAGAIPVAILLAIIIPLVV